MIPFDNNRSYRPFDKFTFGISVDHVKAIGASVWLFVAFTLSKCERYMSKKWRPSIERPVLLSAILSYRNSFQPKNRLRLSKPSRPTPKYRLQSENWLLSTIGRSQGTSITFSHPQLVYHHNLLRPRRQQENSPLNHSNPFSFIEYIVEYPHSLTQLGVPGFKSCLGIESHTHTQ